jgi:hypothetical protein
MIGAEDAIYKKMQPWVVSVKNTAIKLPELIEKTSYVEMEPKEMNMYKKFVKEKVLDIEDNPEADAIIAKNAATLSGKLHQMASGFLYKEKETWEKPNKPEYYDIHTQKLDALKHIINTSSGNILLLYHYQADLQRLTAFLEKLGYSTNDPTKPTYKVFDKSIEMQREWNEKKINIMLLQPQSAGHGINIQHGGYTLVWYSVPTSLEMYQQANARLYRQGQTHTTYIHNIITKNTIDERFLENLHRKASEQEDLKDAVKLTLKQ